MLDEESVKYLIQGKRIQQQQKRCCGSVHSQHVATTNCQLPGWKNFRLFRIASIGEGAFQVLEVFFQWHKAMSNHEWPSSRICKRRDMVCRPIISSRGNCTESHSTRNRILYTHSSSMSKGHRAKIERRFSMIVISYMYRWWYGTEAWSQGQGAK